MPIKKSAIKELRKTVKRTAHNRTYMMKVKEAVRDTRKAVVAKKIDEAKKLAQAAVQLLDKAAQKNMIHRNKAARLKSGIFQTIKKAVS